jgi:thiol-disulfide isomerase/thioredoxin
MNITSPKQYRVAHELSGRVPLSIFLIFSHTCGHCQTYMPIWEKLASMKKKKSNMFMMEADVFNKTPLAKKAENHGIQVNSVPTVLYVSPDGNVREASDIRNESAMTNVVLTGETPSLPPLSESLEEMSAESDMNANLSDETITEIEPEYESKSETESESESESETESEFNSVSESNASSIPLSLPETNVETNVETSVETPVEPNLSKSVNLIEPIYSTDMIIPNTSTKFKSILPGVRVIQDTLPALPATTQTASPTVVQAGGSPWAAFLSSVTPAAALLGAYALLPKKNQRSSGLKRVSRRNKKMTRVSQA